MKQKTQHIVGWIRTEWVAVTIWMLFVALMVICDIGSFSRPSPDWHEYHTCVYSIHLGHGGMAGTAEWRIRPASDHCPSLIVTGG